jgi:hypothetical protein
LAVDSSMNYTDDKFVAAFEMHNNTDFKVGHRVQSTVHLSNSKKKQIYKHIIEQIIMCVFVVDVFFRVSKNIFESFFYGSLRAYCRFFESFLKVL